MAEAPITFRPTAEQRGALARLSEGRSVSDVLRTGLELVESTLRPSQAPLYPRFIEDSDVDDKIEEAVRAACEVLDALFPAGTKQESRGISSEFQGTLKAHIQAMLTGRGDATHTRQRRINALFGASDSLGRIRGLGALEGYCVQLSPAQLRDEVQYLDSERRKFVPLQSLSVGGLFTNEDAARKDYYAWLKNDELSPRMFDAKLCIVAFDEDALKVAEVAR